MARTQEQSKDPEFADGRLGFAVGDVHGRADLLEKMLARIERESATQLWTRPVVVFLGDYVDRGPESAEVISLLVSRQSSDVEWRFLKGNHEQAMLKFLEAPLESRGWLAHGGLETLASYAVRPLPDIGSPDAKIIDAAEQLKRNMPASHRAFLDALERFVVLGDYVFVHAGLDRGAPLSAQRDEDLFWAREKFLKDKRSYDRVIVHGHTPVAAPVHDERRICLDTGAYATGRLSAARFEGTAVRFLSEQLYKA